MDCGFLNTEHRTPNTEFRMTKEGIKAQLLQSCRNHLRGRRRAVEAILANVAISLQEETKSSAGDKHETGRAMLQLERENAGKQLAQIEKLEAILNRVSPEISSGPVHLGSVVMTSQNNYFIAISAGFIRLENIEFFSISRNSPIAMVLLGKIKGQEINFQANHFVITDIF